MFVNVPSSVCLKIFVFGKIHKYIRVFGSKEKSETMHKFIHKSNIYTTPWMTSVNPVRLKKDSNAPYRCAVYQLHIQTLITYLSITVSLIT